MVDRAGHQGRIRGCEAGGITIGRLVRGAVGVLMAIFAILYVIRNWWVFLAVLALVVVVGLVSLVVERVKKTGKDRRARLSPATEAAPPAPPASAPPTAAPPAPPAAQPGPAPPALAPALPSVQVPGAEEVRVTGESGFQAALSVIASPGSEDGVSLETVATLAAVDAPARGVSPAEVSAPTIPEPTLPSALGEVAVLIGGRQVGYLPRLASSLMGPVLAEAGTRGVRVECRALITGGWVEEGGRRANYAVVVFLSQTAEMVEAIRRGA